MDLNSLLEVVAKPLLAVPECGLALGRATNGITIGDLHHAVSLQQHDIPEPPTK